MENILSRRLIYLKAALFLGIGAISSGLLLAKNFELETAILLALVIWSFCRAYYFAFYVIEKYVDNRFRFAGLGSAVKFLWRNKD